VEEKDNFALRGATLSKALSEYHAAGRHPFVLSPLGFYAWGPYFNALLQLQLSEPLVQVP
jgi:hypothetical protein